MVHCKVKLVLLIETIYKRGLQGIFLSDNVRTRLLAIPMLSVRLFINRFSPS